jgi:hypothetical protein
MNDQPTSWKVAIVGPKGVAVEGSAFRLLYAFPTKKEAEKHPACFRHTGVNLGLHNEPGRMEES